MPLIGRGFTPSRLLFARSRTFTSLHRAAMCSSASASTAAATPVPVKQSIVRRTLAFVYESRQALINILGMYFVLSMAIHQFKVQKAWDEREKLLQEAQTKVQRLEQNLTDDIWITELASELRVDPAKLKQVMKSRIACKPETNEHRGEVGNTNRELSIVGVPDIKLI